MTLYNSWGRKEQNWESQLIFDEKQDHYLWMKVGWNGSRRIYYSVIHFDIKDGKIWLQQNVTDLNPAEDLIDTKSDLLIPSIFLVCVGRLSLYSIRF